MEELDEPPGRCPATGNRPARPRRLLRRRVELPASSDAPQCSEEKIKETAGKQEGNGEGQNNGDRDRQGLG
jgi:hypothetical protein